MTSTGFVRFHTRQSLPASIAGSPQQIGTKQKDLQEIPAETGTPQHYLDSPKPTDVDQPAETENLPTRQHDFPDAAVGAPQNLDLPEPSTYPRQR